MNFLRLQAFNAEKLLCRKTETSQRRYLWAWLNMMFNQVEEERLKAVGPDIACAEWILRNGGAIRWSNSSNFLSDFNGLPTVKTQQTIREIDGTKSSISHYGFPYLKGCREVQKIILDNCSYVEDKAIMGLVNVNSPLKFLQISNCANVTDNGLLNLPALDQLETLVLFNLSSVNDFKKCEEAIKEKNPKCNVDIY